MSKFKKYIINRDSNMLSAIKQLDDSNRKILYVINENSTLFGTITDGDIRRWILGGNSLNEPVEKVCNKAPITCKENYEIKDIKNIMLEKQIQSIPVLDTDRNIINILFWDKIFDSKHHPIEKRIIDIPVVIMAGGAGKRLEPFTKILPKPLIPIGDKSVLEVVIDKFRQYSINNFYVSLFHKSQIIKAYLEELNPPYDVKYLIESKPLGTAGVLYQLQSKIKSSIFLTNCDTIISCDYNDLLNFHNKNNYEITIVGSMINHRIPYGICEIEAEGKLVSLKEKPEKSYLVSTGMYLLRGTALDQIPNNEFCNITDLIESVRSNHGNIGVYPISEKSWLDTGEWKEYKNTLEQLRI